MKHAQSNTLPTRSCGALKGRGLNSCVIFQLIKPNILGFAWKAGVGSLWVAEVRFEILHRVTVPWETAKVV